MLFVFPNTTKMKENNVSFHKNSYFYRLKL